MIIKIVLLLGLGLLLIVAEVLIPSMGILGVAAAACILGALVWAFTVDAVLGMQVLVAVALAVPAVVLFAFRILPHSPLGRKLIAGGFSFEDGEATDRRDRGLLGQVGTVEAPLRPAGTARLAGRRVDVMSRGELIESGTTVKVIEVRANRVVVARHQAEAGAESAGEKETKA